MGKRKSPEPVITALAFDIPEPSFFSDTEIDKRDVCLNVACTSCGALRGKPCVTKSGALQAGVNVHRARLEAIHLLNEKRHKREALLDERQINNYWDSLQI